MASSEVLKWLAVVPALLGLGFAMGFSPTLYGVTLVILARKGRSGASVRWMAAGLAAGSTLLVLIFQVFDPRNLADALRGRVDALVLQRGVDLIASVFFLLGALAVWIWVRRHPHPSHRPAKPPAEMPDRPGAMFFVGVANAVIGVSGIPIMYLAGRVASSVSADLLLRALAYSIFLVALVGPYLLAAWAWDRYPGVAERITSAYAWVLRQDLRYLLGAGLLVAGLVFAGLSLWGGTH